MAHVPRLQARRDALGATLISVLTAGIYFGVVAGCAHVRESGFPYRYAIPAVILLVISAAMFASLAFDHVNMRLPAVLQTVVLAGLLAGITLRYGLLRLRGFAPWWTSSSADGPPR
jgi:hypothetical protein